VFPRSGGTKSIAPSAACLVTSLSPALVLSYHERGLMGWLRGAAAPTRGLQGCQATVLVPLGSLCAAENSVSTREGGDLLVREDVR